MYCGGPGVDQGDDGVCTEVAAESQTENESALEEHESYSKVGRDASCCF